MGKKILCILLLLLACASLVACGSTGQERTDLDYGVANLPLGMYLSVKEIADGVATLEIDNQSGYAMTYTGAFLLEVRQNGQWETVPALEEAVTEDVLYTIPDLEKNEYTIDLYATYGTLVPGHYRLTQDDMSAEFDI